MKSYENRELLPQLPIRAQHWLGYFDTAAGMDIRPKSQGSTMRHLLPAVLLAAVTCWTASGQVYGISTFAGGGLPVSILATSASASAPQSVAVDKAGNIFFADFYSDVLRLDAATGVLTLVAGNGTPGFSGDDGLATSAQLNQPEGLAVDSAGNLYITDTFNNRIRKVSNGVITTVAGNGVRGFGGDNGSATSAQLFWPEGVAVDAAGNLYIADSLNGRIRKVANGVITTVAELAGGCNGIAVDSAGNIYVSADTIVSKVSNGVITTVAGNGRIGFSGDNGPATDAQLSHAEGLAVDAAGNLYIADLGNNRIRMVSNGVITTVAGNGTLGFSGDHGVATGAQLNFPLGVAVESDGNVYIADTYNNRIRRVSGGVITTVAGNGLAGSGGENGPATGAQLNLPQGVAVDVDGNVYIADAGSSRVYKVSNGVITTVAGNGTPGYSGDNGPATSAQLNQPQGVAVDAARNLYIADTFDNRVRKVSNGVITTVAGNGTVGLSGDNGPATAAQLDLYQSGLAVDSAGNLYIADTLNNRIRKVEKGVITTVAGNGPHGLGGFFSGDNGPATSAWLGMPQGVAVDSAGNLYIADSSNGRIRKVSNGVITTVVGNGLGIGPGGIGDNGPATSAVLIQPQGVAVDSAGNLYIADTGNYRIRKVANGVITTAAGNGTPGFGGDNGPATGAQFNVPQGVAVDAAGNIYVADTGNNSTTNGEHLAHTGNNRIRLLTPGAMPTIFKGGVVPNDGSVPVIQPGSWVSIYGSNLASGTFVWNGDFPTSLGGTSVTIDNKPAYLWFVSPTQINLQVPDDTTTGPVNVAVTTATGTAVSTVMLSPYGPSFSLLGDGKHVAAEIATPNGSGAYGGGTYDLVGPSGTFSYNTRPVNPGETLTLYGVGFGPTTPHVPAGQLFFGMARTGSPISIDIGGVAATVVFAGITEAGLYQFNLTVPNAPSGDQPLQATVNGVLTPPGPVVTVQ
jgi:uncharacterized protein (TIGR03437 family)